MSEESRRELRAHLLTTDDAATVAGVSVATIHQWARRGFLTRHGSPRMALWDWREVADAKHARRGEKRRVA